MVLGSFINGARGESRVVQAARSNEGMEGLNIRCVGRTACRPVLLEPKM